MLYTDPQHRSLPRFASIPSPKTKPATPLITSCHMLFQAVKAMRSVTGLQIHASQKKLLPLHCLGPACGALPAHHKVVNVPLEKLQVVEVTEVGEKKKSHPRSRF